MNELHMNKLIKTVISSLIKISARISPASKIKQFNNKFNSQLNNLSDATKNRISIFYLTLFLFFSFASIWFAYYNLKMTLQSLYTFRHTDCALIADACSDTWLSGYVKQNYLKTTSILEVLFLVAGVVIGNIGWNQAAEIKAIGLEKLSKYISFAAIVTIITGLIHITCNDLVDIIQNQYYRPLHSLYWELFKLTSLAITIIFFSFLFRKKE
jgi:TRAP-type C4-dicarboxylate transport system permease small subunit